MYVKMMTGINCMKAMALPCAIVAPLKNLHTITESGRFAEVINSGSVSSPHAKRKENIAAAAIPGAAAGNVTPTKALNLE